VALVAERGGIDRAARRRDLDDGDEAVAKGFATEKVSGLKAAALFSAKALEKLKVPAQFKDRIGAFAAQPKPAPQPMAPADVLAACETAGLDLGFARALMAGNPTAATVDARVSAEKASRAAAQARGDEITALCKLANLPELASGYIKGAMSVDDVRAHLTTVAAKIDHVEIDGTLSADNGGKPKSKIDTRAIYARLNQ
jgi:hypothetical protein